MKTQKELKRMTYEELENAVIEHDYRIRHSKDIEEKRLLINESHSMRMEMDRRGEEWEKRRKKMMQ